MLNFIDNFLFKIDLKVVSIMKRKSVISLILRVAYFVPNKIGTNKKADYNWIRGDNGQDTDKTIRVLLFGGCASDGSAAGSGGFDSFWIRQDSSATVGFFTTVKLD